jgi:hypothetical protein
VYDAAHLQMEPAMLRFPVTAYKQALDPLAHSRAATELKAAHLQTRLRRPELPSL